MTTDHSQSLLGALGISDGIVCAVGAGGKKSLLYALASEATGRIAMTTTVMTLRFPRRFRQNATVDADASLRQALTHPGSDGIYAYACPPVKPGRWAGVAPDTIGAIHNAGDFGLTLVKADGARMRGIKAPKPGEPVLATGTTLVCPVVSARVIGQPLNADTAHRPELLARVVGAEPETPLTAAHLARLLPSDHGSLQGSAGIRVVPVINQVDDAELCRQATRAARLALAATQRFDRVILTQLRSETPVIAVIRRQAQ